MKNLKKISRVFIASAGLMLLSGCKFAALDPAGHVALVERNLMLTAVGIMLCIVIPVMIALVVFAIKYRANNKTAEYLPDWGHSNKLEAVMWGIPVCVILFLAVMMWGPIRIYDPSTPLPEEVVGNQEPLRVDVVAMDWKWLFIYPEYGVATVNELYAPTNRQVALQLTAQSSINAFWVPSLGTLLYAMPQMNSKLHLISNRDGVYTGRSGNYSGKGFSYMYFNWHSVSPAEFDSWIAKVRLNDRKLDDASYVVLEKAYTEKPQYFNPEYYGQIDRRLYYRVVNRCVGDTSEESCNEQLMRAAAKESLWGELCSVFDPDKI